MPRRFGADSSAFQDSSIPLTDASGIPLVNTSNSFGSSPLGNSLREQIQFGLPNASFNALPPDPSSPIVEGENPLPYWEIQTTDNITATPVFDSTTQTWGVKVDPGTAPAGDYLTLKTRSWVTTDTNLALRQKASLALAKNGTYSGATQWNLTLTAVYYDHTNSGISTAVIGTVYDNATWTSISGTTTVGGSAIAASAAWVEFTIQMTTTATVSSNTSATLQSLLLATSTAFGAFVVTETFTSSGTWTRPAGVTSLIAIVGVGGGGGGASGSAVFNHNNNISATGGGGPSGGSSSWAIIKDLYVGDVSSVTIGIGTAGVGGAGTTISKAAAGTAYGTAAVVSGGSGGATTFGTYLTIPGGGGGVALTAGTAAGAPTSTVYGLALLGSVAGVREASGTAAIPGLAGSASAYAQLPYWQSFAAGSAGGSATASSSAGGTVLTSAPGASGSAGIIGSGGGGGLGQYGVGADANTMGPGGVGGYGAGSGGGAARVSFTATTTAVATGGNGGNAAANSGASGGGGGGASVNDYPKGGASTAYNASTITCTSGSGGNGGAGRLYVVYVA